MTVSNYRTDFAQRLRHAQRLNEMHNVSDEIPGLYQLSSTRVNEKTDPQGSVLSFRVGMLGRTRIEHKVRGGVAQRRVLPQSPMRSFKTHAQRLSSNSGINFL